MSLYWQLALCTAGLVILACLITVAITLGVVTQDSEEAERTRYYRYLANNEQLKYQTMAEMRRTWVDEKE